MTDHAPAGGDDDDPAVPEGAHAADDRLDQPEVPGQVHLDLPPPARRVGIEEGAHGHVGGVRDEHLHGTERLVDRRYYRRGRLRVGDVTRDRDAADLLGELAEPPFLGDVVDRDPVAVGREPPRRCPADAPGGTGDQRDQCVAHGSDHRPGVGLEHFPAVHGALRGQVVDGARDLFRCHQAAQRQGRQVAALAPQRVRREQRGVRRAGGDGVDPDAGAGDLQGQGLDEAEDRALGRDVVQVGRAARQR